MKTVYIIKDEARRTNAITYLEQMNIAKPIEVVIKPYKRKRTNSQNNLYWMWINEIHEETGELEAKLHMDFAVEFLGIDEVMSNGELLRIPKSTTSIGVEGMSKYLMSIEERVQEYVKLTHPHDYEFAMMR